MQGDLRSKRLKTTRADKEEYWDQISGLALSQISATESALHLTFHISNGRSKLYTLRWPMTNSSSKISNKWMHVIQHYADAFSDEYRLSDHVQVRIWGFMSSPTRNTVALCISTHPSDMIQYYMSSEQFSKLIISDEAEHLPPLNSKSLLRDLSRNQS